jgi:hypothetical protein
VARRTPFRSRATSRVASRGLSILFSSHFLLSLLLASWITAVRHTSIFHRPSSLILYVYLTCYVYNNAHIKRLQHISQNILTRKQFLGPRSLFEEHILRHACAAQNMRALSHYAVSSAEKTLSIRFF